MTSILFVVCIDAARSSSDNSSSWVDTRRVNCFNGNKDESITSAEWRYLYFWRVETIRQILLVVLSLKPSGYEQAAISNLYWASTHLICYYYCAGALSTLMLALRPRK